MSVSASLIDLRTWPFYRQPDGWYYESTRTSSNIGPFKTKRLAKADYVQRTGCKPSTITSETEYVILAGIDVQRLNK